MSDASGSLAKASREYAEKSLDAIHEMASRIADLEAENERLQDRRCDGCVFKGKTCEPYRVWGCVHPDFSCNRWTARVEKP